MPNEVLYITFIAMVAVIMVNIVCAIDHKKAEKDAKKWEEIYFGINGPFRLQQESELWEGFLLSALFLGFCLWTMIP